MMKVELVYEKTCPNVDAARAQIRKAFTQINRGPAWQEWEVSDSCAPSYVHVYGSPTILVNGNDVSGLAPGDCRDNCRIYKNGNGHLGVVPPLEKIVSALLAAGETHADNQES
jgi:hypothetical protein